jgi:hypothetical protein
MRRSFDISNLEAPFRLSPVISTAPSLHLAMASYEQILYPKYENGQQFIHHYSSDTMAPTEWRAANSLHRSIIADLRDSGTMMEATSVGCSRYIRRYDEKRAQYQTGKGYSPPFAYMQRHPETSASEEGGIGAALGASLRAVGHVD